MDLQCSYSSRSSAEYIVLFRILSEHTPQGLKKTVLGQTLLNGNNITMVGEIPSNTSFVTSTNISTRSLFPAVKVLKALRSRMRDMYLRSNEVPDRKLSKDAATLTRMVFDCWLFRVL